jgi:hypothetical protein
VVNHFVECIAPWLLIVPGLPLNWRRAGGIIQLVFQSVLITSGNLSFLNWLTMVPAIICLDDAFLQKFLFTSSKHSATVAAAAAASQPVSVAREVVSVAFFALILKLSIPVVKNLLSKNQIMNRSFDPLRLVNTYGAFGVVDEEREEFIISSASNYNGPWKEYEFKVKPGNVYRSPKWISPYHHRIDWQMWIASTCKTMERSPWLMPFLIKLLEQDKEVTSLLEEDPWKDSPDKPKYIQIERYRYTFHKPEKGENNPPYWDREFIGRVYPRQGLASIDTLQDGLR